MTGRPTTSQPAQPSGTFRATLAQTNGGIMQNSGDEDGVTNAEWQLADLVDAVAAEIDHAEDTLSLKSFARGMAFAIKQLSLDLEVTVRRAPDGRILFRTVDPDQSSATVLKLDFSQVIQSQLQGLRKPLDEAGDERVLATLPSITQAEIVALNAVAIFSVGDLERYTRTAAMVAEVSRKTGIPDPRIRLWRQLPFISEVKPPSGPRGSTIVLEGGNFGAQRDPNSAVLFQGLPAPVVTWSDSRLTVIAPEAGGPGVLFAVIGGQPTNAVAWEATTIDLRVRDLAVTPAHPVEGDPVTVEAILVNEGSGAAGPFQVQWTVDGGPQEAQPHGPLQPGQRSMESSTRRQLSPAAGSHTVQFAADVQHVLPDVDRANSTFTARFVVGALQQLTIADFRTLTTLDPALNGGLGPADVLSLVFCGLGRLDPAAKGALVPDVAAAWKQSINADGTTTLTIQLSDRVRFHDGTPLTAGDVAFTYGLLRKSGSPWQQLAASIVDVTPLDDFTLSFTTRGEPPARLLTAGIVPRRSYEADPAAFGQAPVGSGPFQVEKFAPGEVIALRAFREYAAGAPRLDRLTVSIVPDADRLADMVAQDEVRAAVLPYSDDLRNRLQSAGGNWLLVPLPEDGPTALHVQSPNLQERAPNAFDTNWNAHLWYFPTSLGLTNLSLARTLVIGGDAVQGTVTLSGQAPIGGATVALASSNPSAAAVPASVTVPEGQTGASFTVTTEPVGGQATITASRAGVTRSVTLTTLALLPPALSATAVVGGAPVTGTVRLSGPAPAGGVDVGLTSTNAAVATVPATVRVAEGQSAASFTIATKAVGGQTTIAATLAGVTLSATLATVALAEVGLSASRVFGGASVQGVVTLSGPASSGGVTVALASSNQAVATVPASVVVPEGQNSVAFAVSTKAVGDSTTITATLAGVTQSVALTTVVLLPPALSAAAVIGTTAVTGTARLSGPAPLGVDVGLASTNTAIATVPATVRIEAGQASASFTISTAAAAGQTDIRATLVGVTQAATLATVILASLGFNPSKVTSGTASTGTVTLSGPVPGAGADVGLVSSRPTNVGVPQTVRVPGGQSGVSFTVTPQFVSSTAGATIQVTVTASLAGVSRAFALAVVAESNKMLLKEKEDKEDKETDKMLLKEAETMGAMGGQPNGPPGGAAGGVAVQPGAAPPRRGRRGAATARAFIRPEERPAIGPPAAPSPPANGQVAGKQDGRPSRRSRGSSASPGAEPAGRRSGDAAPSRDHARRRRRPPG